MSEVASLPQTIHIPSSIDGELQPCNVWASTRTDARPLLISLHTWGGAYDQKSYSFVSQGLLRQWHCVMPHFRGPNVRPEACGSSLARQDILDAVEWAKQNLNVDSDRIYIAGGSGGGHMTLCMVSEAPHLFAGATSWCPITDLAAWHREHVKHGEADHYARDIVACVGGLPGSSPEVDKQIKDRSPVYHIQKATDVYLDIAHGILDGKTGSVPFWHSIWAFNRIAQAMGAEQISQREIDELWNDGKLSNPRPEDVAADPAYGDRAIYLRRHAGRCRLTIFHGGHDVVPVSAASWLERCSLKGPIEPEKRPAAVTGGSDANTIAG